MAYRKKSSHDDEYCPGLSSKKKVVKKTRSASHEIKFNSLENDIFQYLSSELFIEILLYLNDLAQICKCARVNKFWKEHTDHPLLWTKINIYALIQQGFDITHKQMKVFLERASTSVKYLNFERFDNFDVKLFLRLTENFKNLTYLNLTECPITSDCIEELSKNTPKLKYLILSNSDSQIFKGYFVDLLKNCKQLTTLDLSECGLDETAISEFAPHMTHLQKLDISYQAVPINHIAQNCTNLTYLNMSKIYKPTVDDYKLLSSNCTKLQTLIAPFMDISTIHQFSSMCHQLTYLNICESHKTTDYFFLKELAKCFKTQIRHLNIFCSDWIRCSYSDDGIIEIAKNCTELLYFNFGFNYNTKELSNDSIIAIGENLIHLQELHTTGMKDINEKTITILAKNCINLKKLTLRSSGIDDDCVYAITDHCKNITYLDFDFCAYITCESIKKIDEKVWKTIRSAKSGGLLTKYYYFNERICPYTL